MVDSHSRQWIINTLSHSNSDPQPTMRDLRPIRLAGMLVQFVLVTSLATIHQRYRQTGQTERTSVP